MIGADHSTVVVAGNEEDRGRCDRYVDRHPGGTLYHSSAWTDVIEQAFGMESVILKSVDASGAINGVLPLVRIRSRLLGHRLVSMPFCNYGGTVADDEQIAESLRQSAISRAEEAGARLELREVGGPLPAWDARTDKVIMTLGLPETADDLGRSIGAKRRSQIRRPLKEGAEVDIGGAELIDDFYGVFARNMRDLGTPVYPARFFRVIAQRLPENLRIVIVRVGGKAAAAAFLLRHKGHVEIPWASSLREFNRIGVNMLLYWESLSASIDAGDRVFDFGRSTRNSGTYRFKKQWGAEPLDCRWLEWPGGDGGGAGEGRLRRWGSAAWKKLPLGLANRLGPMISPVLPW